MAVISLPELKVCRTLEQLTHTFRLTNTRHFNHQSTFLSFEFLNVWLYYTILVDTVCHNVVRVIDSGSDLVTKSFLHFCIGTLCAHLAFKLLCSEHFSKFMTWSNLVISINEECYEVFLTTHLFLFCLSHSLLESGILLVISQCFHNIWY